MVNFENGVTPINDTNLNKVQQDLHDEIEERKAVTLYENAEGSIENITLNDSVLNYKTFEIEYCLGAGGQKIFCSTGKISSSAQKVMLQMNRAASESVLQIIANLVSISGNSIIRETQTYVTISSKVLAGQGNDVRFKITKVTAYDKINTEQEV